MPPILVADLFRELSVELIRLLIKLSPDEWQLPTASSQRNVKDVVSHVLDGSLRRLSLQRDGYLPPDGSSQPQPGEPLVDFLHRFNSQWECATRRLSPHVLVGLLEWAHGQVAILFESLDAFAPALFPVAWAGEDRSLNWMNRGHHADAFFEAVRRCQGRPFDLCAHVILGLPGESRADMLATAAALASLPIHAVKIHNLHVVKDTPLEDMHRRGEAPMMDFEEYVSVACDFLELLPPGMVIERLNGDAPPDYLVAPAWCLDKQRILRAIDEELKRRDSWQGKRYAPQLPGASPRRRPATTPRSNPATGSLPNRRSPVPLPAPAPGSPSPKPRQPAAATSSNACPLPRNRNFLAS